MQSPTWGLPPTCGGSLPPNEDIVQQELVRSYEFIVENKFLISKKKCYTMLFTISKKYAFPLKFTIRGSEILEEMKEATILGVKVSSSLCWESQVQHKIAKASKTVWTLRRRNSLGVECGHCHTNPVLED